MSTIPVKNRAINRKLPFAKLEGLGNCYVFIEKKWLSRINLVSLAREISLVTIGIGADGLIVVEPGTEISSIRIFNRDGTEAEMCGNGLRQAALYLKAFGFSRGKSHTVVTPAGEFETTITNFHGCAAEVKTEMGKPDFSCTAVGLSGGAAPAFSVSFTVAGKRFEADCVSFGNPHAVVFVKRFDFDWIEAGHVISTSPRFRRGANVHFVQIVNRSAFKMRIFERGSGPTAACGSGAAASLAVGVMRNFLNKKATAIMPGGKLRLEWDLSNENVLQVGQARIICTGELLI